MRALPVACAMFMSLADELPLPAACLPPSRGTDWCGSLPAFVSAGWHFSSDGQSVALLGSPSATKRRRVTTAAHSTLATAPALRANAAVPLWLTAPETSPAQQSGQEESGDEEQSVAAALLQRHLAARSFYRRAAPPQPLQPPKPTPSILQSSTQQQQQQQPAEAELTGSLVAAQPSAPQPLPKPLRRPLPSAALLASQQQPSERDGGAGSGQDARSSALGSRKRAAHSVVDAAAVPSDKPFESFDYEAALQSEAEQQAGEQASRRGGGGRRQQRKQSAQSGRAASTQSNQPLEFTRSSRYSGSSRGRQFAA